MPEKMNLVVKDVILEKWKSKIGYSFNFKDLEELEIIINQFDNHIKYLENKLQQKEDIINKANKYVINHLKQDMLSDFTGANYIQEYIEEPDGLLEILDNK